MNKSSLHPLAALALAATAGSASSADVAASGWLYTPLSQEVTNLQIWKDTLWIGTNHGIYRQTPTGTTWYHPTNSLLPGEIVAPGLMKVDPVLGDLWVATNHAVARIGRADGSVTAWDTSTTPILGRSASALDVHDGTVAVLNDTGNFLSIEPSWSGWRTVLVPGRTGPIQALAFLDSTLWIGLGSGTYTLGTLQGSFQSWHPGADTIIQAGVRALFPANGKLWVATNSPTGAYGSWVGDTLILVDPSVGSKTLFRNSGIVRGIASRTGSALIAKGNYVYRDSLVSRVGHPDSHQLDPIDSIVAGTAIANPGISAIAVRNDSTWLGSQWPAGFRSGLFAPGHAQANFQGALQGSRILGQAIGPDGKLWFVTDSGVYWTDAKGGFTAIQEGLSGLSSISWYGDSALYVSDTMSRIGIMRSVKGFPLQSVLPVAADALILNSLAWMHATDGGFIYAVFDPNDPVSGGFITTSKIPSPPDSAPSNFHRLISLGTSGGPTWLWYYGTQLRVFNGSYWATVPGVGSMPAGLDGVPDASAWASFNSVSYGYPTDQTLMRFTIGGASVDSFHLATPVGAVLATSAVNAWTLADYGWGYPYYQGASALRSWTGGSIGVTRSFTSDSSFLHQGLAANTRGVLVPDSAGGLYLVFKDGIQRLLDASLPMRQGKSGIRASAARRNGIRLSGRELSFSISRPGRVELEILGLDGRALHRQDLGALPSGEHRLVLSDLRGARIIRLIGPDGSRTLKTTTF
jgi:hypothetical protein